MEKAVKVLICTIFTITIIISSYLAALYALKMSGCNGCIFVSIADLLGVDVQTQLFVGYADIRGLILTILIVGLLSFFMSTLYFAYFFSERAREILMGKSSLIRKMYNGGKEFIYGCLVAFAHFFIIFDLGLVLSSIWNQ